MTVDSDPGADVSRETLERLQTYHDLVLRWTKKINLISRSSEPHLWKRHIWDSAQLNLYAREGTHWIDLGSGGGFPGIVLAILARETHPDRTVTLVESDQRKCAFLREAIRKCSLSARVISARIEETPPIKADVLTARALSDLSGLLGHADRHLAAAGTALFMKGASWEKEVDRAREHWTFDLTAHRSVTEPGAAVLEIRNISGV